jgi:iron complex transport system substrate-binding protein
MRTAGLLVLTIIIVAILPGCLHDTDEGEVDDVPGDLLPITVVDDVGNNITITKYPERIVSLSASITEILYELNMGDKITAVDSASNYPADAQDKEVIFDGFDGLNVEKFVEHNPDLVFLHHKLDLYETWRNKIWDLGYDIVILDPVQIEDVLDNINLIGKVTNRTEEAKTLMDSLESRIDSVEESAHQQAGETKIKVLYVVWYGGADQGEPWVSGRDTYADDMIEKAGGMNMVTSFEGYEQISPEKIISNDPDIIICSQNSEFPTETREIILADTIFKSTSAVKNGHVYDIDGDTIDRPGPRIVDGLESMFDLLSEV